MVPLSNGLKKDREKDNKRKSFGGRNTIKRTIKVTQFQKSFKQPTKDQLPYPIIG